MHTFIPENLDLELIIKKNPPGFKYHLDYFRYILSLITTIPAKGVNLECKNGFVPINMELVKKFVGNDYKLYFIYLLDHDILLTDGHHIVTKKSTGFKFSKMYNTPIRFEEITKFTLVRKLREAQQKHFRGWSYSSITQRKSSRNERKRSKTKNIDITMKDDKEYLRRWFNPNLKINSDATLNYFHNEYRHQIEIGDTKAINQYNNIIFNTNRIENQDYTFILDPTGRLHTNVTLMNKEQRFFCNYNGEPLCAIDLKAAQPYISTVLFQEGICEIILEEITKQEPILRQYNKTSKEKLREIAKAKGLDFIRIPQRIEEEREKKQARERDRNKQGEEENKGEEREGSLMFPKSSNLFDSKSINSFVCQIIDQDADIYEFFNTKYFERTGKTFPDRDALKKKFLTCMLSDNNLIWQRSMEYKRVFKEIFPSPYQIFNLIKSEQYQFLAWLLQRFESHIIVDNVSRIFSQKIPDKCIYTIHDSVVCPVSYKGFLQKVLRQVAEEFVGFPPRITEKIWDPRNL